jgi:hypothetical protein
MSCVAIAALLMNAVGCGGNKDDDAEATKQDSGGSKQVVNNPKTDDDVAKKDDAVAADDTPKAKNDESGDTEKPDSADGNGGKVPVPPIKTAKNDEPGRGEPKDTKPANATTKDDPKRAERDAKRKKWAEVAQNVNKLKQIALAFHFYHEAYGSFLPDPEGNKDHFDENGKLKLSWRVHLLPFVDDIELYDKFRLDEAWDSENNKPLLAQMPDIYKTDGDTGTKTGFVGFVDTKRGKGDQPTTGMPQGRRIQTSDVIDGTSNTFLVIKAPKANAVNWTAPEDFPFDAAKPEEAAKLLAKEETGLLVAMMDGSVHLLKSDIPAKTLGNLINPQDRNATDCYDLIIRRPDPIEFVEPKTGPIHLAYMHPRAVATIVLHPKAIFESPIVKELFTDEFGDNLFKHTPYDVRKIEEVVIWVVPDNMFQPAYFSMRSNDAATLDGLQEFSLGMPSFKHDDHTVVFAPVAIMQDILGDEAKNEALAALLGKEIPKDQAMAVVSLSHPFLKQFTDPQMLAQLPFLPPNLADERVLGMVQKIESIRFSLDLNNKVLLTTEFKLADAESAGILKEFMTNGMEIAKAQLGELPADDNQVALAKSVAEGISVVTKDNTVTLHLSPNDDLRKKLVQSIKNAMLDGQKSAKRIQERNNLKTIGIAFYNYHETYGMFAPGDNKDWYDENGKPHLSWRVHLLPFLDENALYQKFKLDEPWDSENNKPLLEQMPDLFTSDGVEKKWHTSLMTFSGENTPFNGEGPKLRSITDGTSNTILVVTAGADKAVPWTKPVDLAVDLDDPFKSLGKIGETFQTLLMDGSVRSISDTIDAKTLKNLITPSGSEVIGDF